MNAFGWREGLMRKYNELGHHAQCRAKDALDVYKRQVEGLTAGAVKG